VRFCSGFLLAAAVWAQPQAIVREFTHNSQVMDAAEAYRAFLPPSYDGSRIRYPVIYWLHGYETSAEQDQYNRAVADYVALHQVIVVNAGPVETVGQSPLYFPELVEQVDRTLRTVADRDHRAVTGYSAGGFSAFWTAGKYPDLVSSASSFMGPTEYAVGPKGFPVECNFDDFYANYDAVRTRLVTGTRDFLQFYHRRLNAVWSYARAHHETEDFDSEHGAPAVSKTLDFHMAAFAKPLPQPAVFSHADVYPNFVIWGWDVTSDRRQPGITVLENVSRTGFRSAVREWIPGGATIPRVKLSVVSAPHLYALGSAQPVTFIRLRDGHVRHTTLKADAEGRLNFDLDGDAWEVGIGAAPVLAIASCDLVDASWATAGKPVKLRVKFCNKGGAGATGRSPTLPVQWESPDPAVKFDAAPSRLFGLAPGEWATLPVTLTVADAARAVVQIFAVIGGARLPIEIPLYPAAGETKDFQIADGRSLAVYQHAVQKGPLPLGEGNGDGYAAPGESFAVLLPDGDAYRAAEVFTADACVDNSMRASDSWVDYDHSGASVKYSLPRILPTCPPGTVIHLLARVVMPNAPNHQVRYWALEFPVWWRNEK
jgi:pimeloyl-ACP methyl ester carboxylesterase